MNERVISATAIVIHSLTSSSSSSSLSWFLILTSLFVFPPTSLFVTLLLSPPLSSLTHSEIHTEMLKLAASTSAPALAPKASGAGSRGCIKDFIKYCTCTCVHTDTHTNTAFSFILIHTFILPCTTEHLHGCTNAQTNTAARTETQSNKAGHSGPPPSGCLCQPPNQLCVPSYVSRQFSYFHLSE